MPVEDVWQAFRLNLTQNTRVFTDYKFTVAAITGSLTNEYTYTLLSSSGTNSSSSSHPRAQTSCLDAGGYSIPPPFFYWVSKPSRNLRFISWFYYWVAEYGNPRRKMGNICWFFLIFLFPCREKSCLSLHCYVVSLCIVSCVRILLGLRGLG